MEYHNPVLLEESVDGLNIKPDGVYVDVTFGGGGHSREILNRLGENGKLYAFDQDTDALQNKINDPRFTLINENFRFIKRFLRFYGVKKVDGILGDFGVSSHQFNEAERGFSTRFNAKLDMRMDQKSALSAYQVINEYEEEQLKSLFYQYADLKNAPKLARIIAEERKNGPIENSENLNELLKPHLFKGKENKILAQIYQAIRIEVNQELEVLKEFLLQTEDMLEKNGRISLISYHSLEDRLVKRYIRSGLFEGEPEKDFYGNISVPFKKVGRLIVPTQKEISENNRARSAKLRIAKKL
ncbi:MULTISPECIES: 16S rRNA (cytosine(1402)-N(4))-methyltransferase RsmH [unclassified Zunongwangia]|uniref:16S rRNA (cytosine(1402)-N(4))-methyltransferase RsmH n=1 Tax=unclassified Zunongwangia TaxID=2632541 RepID=UPI0022DD77AC|nr:MULTISPECIES: 16S rRNA (cytosine(1402)-N(4))-methyltransferase RsmH [unclassified Zunongwangia]WBL21808.1 16S rRNA (cytosine(1402)-N(4))-methyltransferase RsmH [Zunongwangia sp. HRR-M8]WBL26244.1 16S rRNA (cytosine(1402)-N(4))-methyltransferase RsmH [Zunongwangia sp. HGR-M22]